MPPLDICKHRVAQEMPVAQSDSILSSFSHFPVMSTGAICPLTML